MDVTRQVRPECQGKFAFEIPDLDEQTVAVPTIELVYVLGTANTNHQPSPRAKPLPFAETRSRTIRPSKRATMTLSTVRAIRKKVCRVSRNASLPVFLGSKMLCPAPTDRAELTSGTLCEARLEASSKSVYSPQVSRLLEEAGIETGAGRMSFARWV